VTKYSEFDLCLVLKEFRLKLGELINYVMNGFKKSNTTDLNISKQNINKFN